MQDRWRDEGQEYGGEKPAPYPARLYHFYLIVRMAEAIIPENAVIIRRKKHVSLQRYRGNT